MGIRARFSGPDVKYSRGYFKNLSAGDSDRVAIELLICRCYRQRAHKKPGNNTPNVTDCVRRGILINTILRSFFALWPSNAGVQDYISIAILEDGR